MGLKHLLSDGLAKRCRVLLCIFRVAGQGNILAGHALDGWVSKGSEGLFLFVMEQAAFIR